MSSPPEKNDSDDGFSEVDQLASASRRQSVIRQESMYYQDTEKDADLTGCMILKMAMSLLLPFVSLKFRKYPDMLNLHVLRVVDFMAAVTMCISIILTVISFSDPAVSEATSMRIFTSLSVLLLFLDKVNQIFRLPAWKAHRIIAYKVFGPEFLPVGSTGRRGQMAIFAVETVLVFDPFVKYISEVMGASRPTAYYFLLGFKVFLLFFYLSMAYTAWCPAWALMGLLTKYGYLPHPTGELTAVVCENLSDPSRKCRRLPKAANYFYSFDTETMRVTHLRYGLWGPRLENKKKKNKIKNKVPSNKVTPVEVDLTPVEAV